MMLAWKEGGWWMQPLGAVLVLTVYVIVERALWFQRSAFDAEEPFELLKERGRSRDLAGAITQCTLIRTPVVDGSPFPQRTDGRGRVAVAGHGGSAPEPPDVCRAPSSGTRSVGWFREDRGAAVAAAASR
jgi:hypothetical protein